MPVGQITPKQMLRVAEIATLWFGRNPADRLAEFHHPKCSDAYVETVKKALRKIGFDTQQSLLRGGLIACTGNSFCKFAQSNTKGTRWNSPIIRQAHHARRANQHPSHRLPNSCAQHYMGDIGLLGVKVRARMATMFLSRRLRRKSGGRSADFFRCHGERFETDAGKNIERLSAPSRSRRDVPKIHHAQ